MSSIQTNPQVELQKYILGDASFNQINKKLSHLYRQKSNDKSFELQATNKGLKQVHEYTFHQF